MRPFAASLFVGSVVAAAHADPIWVESFETNPGITYLMPDRFSANSDSDYYDRFLVPDTVNVGRSPFATGWDGRWGIFASDLNSIGGLATRRILLQRDSNHGINIAGISEPIQLTISLGASAGNFFDTAHGDGIKIYTKIDSNVTELIARFSPAIASGSAPLGLDADNDGFGEGVQLGTALTDFTFDVPGFGNELLVFIDLTSTDNNEIIALDNVRIAVPEPTSLAAIAVAGLLLARRR